MDSQVARGIGNSMAGSAAVDASLDEARTAVAARLRARRAQIDAAVFGSVAEVAPGTLAQAPVAYVDGLRAVIPAIVELALTVIGDGDANAPIPHVAVVQARRAARLGVTLDTVLRRYIAGSGRLTDFIIEEAHRTATDATLRHALHRIQQALLDRLITAVTEVYQVEIDHMHGSREQSRAALVTRLLVERLLDGQRLTAAELGPLEYWLDAWHIGMIADSEAAVEELRKIGARQHCVLLCISADHERYWAWIGGAHRDVFASLDLLSDGVFENARITCGAPHNNLEGFRLTHREAQAALLIASHQRSGVTWCPNVALEAAVLQDSTLTASLQAAFVDPLDEFRLGGKVARDTLQVYFEANGNTTMASTRLKTSRRTFEARKHEIEGLLGRELDTYSAQLQIALRIDALKNAPA
jgi:hypothetical protein